MKLLTKPIKSDINKMRRNKARAETFNVTVIARKAQLTRINGITIC